MNAKLLAARAPTLVALALVLALVATRSSLAKLLPWDLHAPAVFLALLGLLALALVPALFARATPLGAAAVVAVPVLAAASYGVSRLDWLRVLKDFGVAEPRILDPWRLALGVVALLLLWTLHATDLALRLRLRAAERGIAPREARAASSRVLARSAQAAGLALAGAVGLLVVGVLGLNLGRALPTERAALVAPLLAAAVLVAAAVWLARGRGEES